MEFISNAIAVGLVRLEESWCKKVTVGHGEIPLPILEGKELPRVSIVKWHWLLKVKSEEVSFCREGKGDEEGKKERRTVKGGTC